MIILLYLGFMFLVHWIGDFIFQSDAEAKGKSTSNKMLLRHTGKYSLIWTIAMYGIGVIQTGFGWPVYSLLFGIITFVCHTITDYFTSRLVKKRFEKGDHHNGFVIIGADQILHYVQLILTFTLIYL
jgi:hypothetical protein